MTTYHLATSPENPGGAVWRAAVAAAPRERPDRVVENGVRYLVARLAVAEGGLALHGAGVLRGRRAFVFAGPSRSGKTTAVGLSSDTTSLGDDFAVLLPREGGWRTAAVPFDNLERGPADPPRGLFPVAGVWRLFQADEAAIETPAGPQAVASLTSCAAFPWAMPDLAAAVLEHAQRFVSESCFGHLRFGRDPDFWKLLPAD
jgi:hypothetical protein